MRDKRFLVVEDEPSVADFVRTVIELEGGTVVLAPTGERALESCRSGGPFDLMVLDLSLPDTSGWELMRSTQRLLPDCKVMIFSAQMPDSYEPQVLPACVVMSLVKPAGATALRDALRSALRPAPGR